MQLDKLNQWLMFGANIGVILGIIFLALEVQQNNELMAAQNRYNRLTNATGTMTLMATNPQLAELLTLLETEERDLKAAESLQVSTWHNRVFANMEWGFREVPLEDLPLNQWQSLAQTRGFRISWPQMKANLDPAFVDYMESNTSIDGD